MGDGRTVLWGETAPALEEAVEPARAAPAPVEPLPSEDELGEVHAAVYVDVVVERKTVSLPALTDLEMRIVDSGPGGAPPFEVQIVVGRLGAEEVFNVERELPAELAKAFIHCRRVFAHRYRARRTKGVTK